MLVSASNWEASHGVFCADAAEAFQATSATRSRTQRMIVIEGLERQFDGPDDGKVARGAVHHRAPRAVGPKRRTAANPWVCRAPQPSALDSAAARRGRGKAGTE